MGPPYHVHEMNKSSLLGMLQEPLVDWIAMAFSRFGCALRLVTDQSEKGVQFCLGFGGIGGLMEAFMFPRFHTPVGCHSQHASSPS
mgnify:CR=1 FL=1